REALNGNKVHRYSLSIKCDRPWEVEDYNALAQLVVSTKTEVLDLNYCPQLIHNGLHVGRFMRACAPALKELSSNDKQYVGNFPAPKMFLPILNGYNYLNIPALTIQAEWIGEVCMVLLDRVNGQRGCRETQWSKILRRSVAKRSYITWRISGSRELSPRELSQQISN
ncbi:hypothetical protein PMAYCL1PPCAC_26417, partial [Pristionchus mayeri]